MTSPDKDVAAIEARLTETCERVEREFYSRQIVPGFTHTEVRALLAEIDRLELTADIAALLAENKRLREGRDIEQTMLRNAVAQIGALEAEDDLAEAVAEMQMVNDDGTRYSLINLDDPNLAEAIAACPGISDPSQATRAVLTVLKLVAGNDHP